MNTRIFIVAGLLLATGCESGVPSSTLLSAVTDEESRDICEEISPSLFRPTTIQSCSLSALFATTTTSQSECEAARDDCLETAPTLDPLDCSTTDRSEFDGCPPASTVGDFRVCMNAANALLADIYGRADCANFGTELEPTVTELGTPPPACVPINGCGSEP